MISVVDRRPVDGAIALAHREVVRNRDRFPVGDEEAMKRPLQRRPAPHPRGGPRPVEENRRAAAEIVAPAVSREMPFMRAPAELGRLAALAHEAFDRPGVDELSDLFGLIGHLRVALGDVDDLDRELLRQARPFRFLFGRR